MENNIRVIYQDKNFLAVYKPADLLVHKTVDSSEPTLVDWLLKKYPEIKNVGDAPEIRPGIVHRLDKDTSGVVLIARNQQYFEYLKNLFGSGGIRKNYLALVYGKVEPKTGIIEKPIYLKPGTTKRSVWQGKMKKEAITEYEVIKSFKRQETRDKDEFFTLLKVSPKTGRTHQIRVHLASIGHPVVGDTLYGKKADPFNLKRLFLHAESLEFNQSNGKKIKIESELPDELKNLLKKIVNRK